jgi:hypothetical protein
MQDASKRKVSVFTDSERQGIVADFDYYNVRKERGNEVLPTDPFGDHQLSHQTCELDNTSTRSIVLAPFNSTKSNLDDSDSISSSINKLLIPRSAIKFSAKVKEIDRQYELNNNAMLDNGVYNQDDKNQSDLQSSFNAEQLQSQLSELNLEEEDALVKQGTDW